MERSRDFSPRRFVIIELATSSNAEAAHELTELTQKLAAPAGNGKLSMCAKNKIFVASCASLRA
jgi:hypothetical protein